MSSEQYIPRSDAKFLTWAKNFVDNINDAPSAFMLSPANAKDLKKRYDEFAQALLRANNKLTRNVQSIADKVDARNVLESLCRDYAGLIRANKGITDGDKLLLRIRPTNTSRRRRKCPQVAPMLNYIASTPGIDHLLVRSPLTNRFAKPYNAAGIELWVVYTPPGCRKLPDREDAKFLGAYGDGRIHVDRDFETHDWAATYWARYVGHRHDTGPFSLPTSSRIAAAEAQKKREAKSKQQREKPDEDAGGEILKKAA